MREKNDVRSLRKQTPFSALFCLFTRRQKTSGTQETKLSIQSNEPLHIGHLGDKRKWPLWRGGRYGKVGVF